MKVRIKEGVNDFEPYNEAGDVQNFSGFTGACQKKEYESAVEEDDVVLVSFDKKSLNRLPSEYIAHADEEGEDYTKYYFYKTDIEVL